MSEKQSNFPSMASFKDAMTIPILDETLADNVANERFTITQLKALISTVNTSWTPANLTIVSNIDAIANPTGGYEHGVNGIVKFWFTVSIDATVDTTVCIFTFDLPIATLGGSGGEFGSVFAQTDYNSKSSYSFISTTKGQVQITTGQASARGVQVTGVYEVS